MHYDDMLSTVLAQPCRDAAARVRLWRQVVDLLTQGRDAASPAATVDQAYHALRALRGEVPLAVRMVAAQGCLDRPAARLVHFFAEDAPEVAGPLLARVRLDAADWRILLPLLSPFALGQLRARSDLPGDIAYALGIAGGAADRDDDLDRRIAQAEARRVLPPIRTSTAPPTPAPAPTLPAAPIAYETFRFTADESGLLQLRGAGPAEAAGVSIAQVAAQPDHGVDGHAAGAWRRRAAFTDARLSIGGDAPGAGQWRISGEPCFAAPDGRFVGYAGEARRPRAEKPAPVVVAEGDAPDAGRIARLLAAVRGPLDIAARAPAPAAPVGDRRGSVQPLRPVVRPIVEAAAGAELDAAAILTRLHAACQPNADARGARLSFRIAAGLPPIAADPAAVERMFTRLLAAAIGISRRGECVAVRVGLDRQDGSLLALALSRPGVLAGLDEVALMAPGDTDAEGADAPRLALSFAIRLVRNLAVEAGGRLDIAPDRLILTLPLSSAGLQPAEERRG